MRSINRRQFLRANAAAALGLSVVGVTGCAPGRDGGGSGSGSGGGNSVRFAWWGGTDRQQMYSEALDLFMQEHPDIDVAKEFAEYTAFQDRIATQMAGGNAPDIFWIASTSVLTFYENGMYYSSLEELENLDLSAIPKSELESFKIDGELNTMPIAAFCSVVRWNQTFLEEAGMELPAEDNWTWESLAEFLTEYQKQAPEGRRATSHAANADLPFESWIRQHGQELWTEDGNVGFDAEVAGGWLAWWDDLRKAGVALSLSEQDGPSADWNLVGDTVLMNLANSNHITDDSMVFPDYEFQQRLVPVMPDATPGHAFVYTPRMTIYSQSPNPEAAAQLIHFLINSEEVPKITGTTMGAPINPRQREIAYETGGANAKKVIDTTEKARSAERKPRYEAPPGASTWRTIFNRTIEEVSLERTTIPAAAKSLVSDIQAEIDAER